MLKSNRFYHRDHREAVRTSILFVPALRDGIVMWRYSQASLTPPGSFSLGYYVTSPPGSVKKRFSNKSFHVQPGGPVHVIAQAEAPRRGKRSLGNCQPTHTVPEGRHKTVSIFLQLLCDLCGENLKRCFT